MMAVTLLTHAPPGMHGNETGIMRRGAVLYGKALNQLHGRLKNDQTCYDEKNVAATIALHLYEVVVTPQKLSSTFAHYSF